MLSTTQIGYNSPDSDVPAATATTVAATAAAAATEATSIAAAVAAATYYLFKTYKHFRAICAGER